MAAQDVNDFVKEEYDFLVIGGGTAGLVVAARLSERADITVGVLEAGKDHSEHPVVNTPGLHIAAIGDPDLDWSFTTVPQTHLSASTQVHHWPRGKGLGGSSAINFSMFAHASRADLDNWSLLGNPLWTYDTLAPYYRKCETFHPPSARTAEAYGAGYLDGGLRGREGPIQTCFAEGEEEVAWPVAVWPETCRNAGYPEPGGDLRTGTAVGGFNMLTAMEPVTHRRSYAGSAYWWPNRGRGNLRVLTEAMVSGLLWEGEGGGDDGKEPRACGARCEVKGKRYEVRAKREVIVCCGTIQSPQLLQVSGVGPKQLLQERGVDVVVENENVGENLQDHLMAVHGFATADGVPTGESFRSPEIFQSAIEAYQKNQSGPLSSFGNAAAFLPLSLLVDGDEKAKDRIIAELDAQPAPTVPAFQKQFELQRVQMLSDQEAVIQMGFFAGGFDIDKVHDQKEGFAHPAFDGHWMSFGMGLERVFSRGSVRITSSDMKIQPAIDPRYLEHPTDVELAAYSLLHCQKFVQTEPLLSKAKRDADGKLEPLPGFVWVNSLDEAREVVRKTCFTMWHPVGTCAMLPRELNGVVDQGGKVYGARGLRVCDASIIPILPQGNIMTLVYATAEKISDHIKADHGF